MYLDGRGTNKPWLLENPDPITKITWQSWVEMHPDTAAKVDVRDGEIVALTTPHGTIRASVYVYAGIRPDTLAMPLGLGHTEYGRYAKGRGVNALDLIGSADGQGFLPYVGTRVSVALTGDYRQLARCDGNPRQLGPRHGTGDVARACRAGSHARGGVQGRRQPGGGGKHRGRTDGDRRVGRRSSMPAASTATTTTEQPKWGMAVDLSRCTGCSACVTACYAENNIPTVGEAQVLKRREMSWMRIERYWEGGEDGEPLAVRFAPVMCQQCNNAPCEPVCPVYASYHTPDGLNGQVYNRCVGTRYCSNNCPFKVRYFNWLKYNDAAWPEPLNLQLNPEVTVRARGVMEKCTFCIQRIRHAQFNALLEQRDVRDGEIVTACQQACPSGAIRFGNQHSDDSPLMAWKRDSRGYTMLEDTDVEAQVTYLAKVLHGPQPADRKLGLIWR